MIQTRGAGPRCRPERDIGATEAARTSGVVVSCGRSTVATTRWCRRGRATASRGLWSCIGSVSQRRHSERAVRARPDPRGLVMGRRTGGPPGGRIPDPAAHDHRPDRAGGLAGCPGGRHRRRRAKSGCTTQTRRRSTHRRGRLARDDPVRAARRVPAPRAESPGPSSADRSGYRTRGGRRAEHASTRLAIAVTQVWAHAPCERSPALRSTPRGTARKSGGWATSVATHASWIVVVASRCSTQGVERHFGSDSRRLASTTSTSNDGIRRAVQTSIARRTSAPHV